MQNVTRSCSLFEFTVTHIHNKVSSISE